MLGAVESLVEVGARELRVILFRGHILLHTKK